MNSAPTRPGDIARQLITALWDRSLPIIYERLNILDRACEAAVSEELTSSIRRSAADTAHKLAGSLGMFGYPRGTELAREIEHLLESDDPVDAIAFRRLALLLRSSLPL